MIYRSRCCDNGCPRHIRSSHPACVQIFYGNSVFLMPRQQDVLIRQITLQWIEARESVGLMKMVNDGGVFFKGEFNNLVWLEQILFMHPNTDSHFTRSDRCSSIPLSFSMILYTDTSLLISHFKISHLAVFKIPENQSDICSLCCWSRFEFNM